MKDDLVLNIDLDKACVECGALGTTKSGLCLACVTKSFFENKHGMGITSIKRHADTGMIVNWVAVGPDAMLDGHVLNCKQDIGADLHNLFRRMAHELNDHLGLKKSLDNTSISSLKIDRKKSTMSVAGDIVSGEIGSVGLKANKIPISDWREGGKVLKLLLKGVADYVVNRTRQLNMFEETGEAA